MIQKIEDIKKQIAADYNDLSQVSILRHMQDVVAIAFSLLENLFSSHKRNIERIEKYMQYGTLDWYRQKALLFQFDHELVLVNVDLGGGLNVSRPGYETIDASAQIIKYAAATESINSLLIKVAKEDKTDLLTPDEREAINAYFFNIKYPGTKVLLVNILADEFTIEVDVVVNKQIITSNGSKIGDSDIYPVNNGIFEFFDSSEFGGVFFVNKFEDAIQEVDGVISVRLKDISALSYTGVETQIYKLATGVNILSYVSEAGHIALQVENLNINYL